jgi:hypothetical protein
VLDRLLEAGLGNHVRLSLLADNGWLVQLECPTLCVYIHTITNIGDFLQCRKKGVKCEYSPYSPELRQKVAFLGRKKSAYLNTGAMTGGFFSWWTFHVSPSAICTYFITKEILVLVISLRGEIQ